jgi:protein-disulfide isomerase
MIINRRTFTTTAAAAAIAAAAGGLLTAPALAQSLDVAEFHAEPRIGDKAIGPADAKVTIVEYASATCPHCAKFHTTVFPEIKKEFVETGKVRYIAREFPLDDLALAAFMVARCVPDDKYFGMLDLIYEQQQTWATQNAREELLKMAKLAGLSEAQFEECLKNEDLAKGILEIRKDGSEKYGVDATPTLYLNGQKMEGERDIEAFRKAINEALGS